VYPPVSDAAAKAAGWAHLHPDRRKEIRSARLDLGRGRGDCKELAGSLMGFYRFRIGRYRIVYRHQEKHIEAIFLEQRSVIYELFRP
jgi:mRNA-degrading endonuclease RelE of RelBE toxin-antitoxin system